MNTWIFQGNPKVFDINSYIKNHKYIWWSLRQEHFLDKIELGDEVFLWRSDGNNRGTGGILAKARVISLPEERADDENAKNYWYTDEWENPYLAIKLEVLQVRLEDGFISRLSLLEHPILKELLILRLRQKTNYLLSPEHAIILQKLWNNSHNSVQSKVNVEINMKNLVSGDITETEREQVIKSRIGQSVFKKELVAMERKCQLCGVCDERFLIASHIKPWSKSNHKERLDVNNGLLLCPNHDSLFDKGYISFDDNGTILISKSLDEDTKVFLNINDHMNIEINVKRKHYIEWHRNNVFTKLESLHRKI
ncbi:HNH endonuclease [Priestia flexa]|uniref:HNH endonuclease n=1 Tax=Priestia flexa TaxID=86664 RepID=A0ABU4JBV6_9BACI|nr:HNH endonuclease [Priestia flexa]MDW8518501.1 HNH endonuclease [Priestia flexa]